MSNLEARSANRLMVYAILLAASYTLMRTVGDSLFLSRIGSDSLATVFLASGISTAVISSVWFVWTRRLSLSVSIRASGLAFAVLTFAAWAALPFLDHSWWLLAAIYLLTEIKGCVNAINIVSAMNEVLGGHSSRQSWARIGLGTPLAGVMIGALLGVEASFIDLSYWLLLSSMLDLLSVVPLANTAKWIVPRTSDAGEKSLQSTVSAVAKRLEIYVCSRQFRFWIGVLIAAKVVVLTLVSFFWKVSVNEYFSGNEQSLTRYFGVFYACIGLLTLLIQGFLTGYLISRQRSLHFPILLMPVVLMVLAVVALFSVGAFLTLTLVTVAKSLEIWRRSVHDTTLNLLYTNIERANRRTAIAVNSAAIKPLSEVGASLVLLLGTAVWYKSVVGLGLVVWMLSAIELLRLVTRRKKKLKAIAKAASLHGTAEEMEVPVADSDIEEFIPRLFND